MKNIVNAATKGKSLYKKVRAPFSDLKATQTNSKQTSLDVRPQIQTSEMSCPETGLLNRTAITDQFDKTIPSDLQKMCLILIEIDDFSAMSSKHSKRTLSHIVNNFVNEVNNISKETDVLVRWSPSEFLLVCPLSEQSDTSVFAKKISRIILNSTWKKKLNITCSTATTQIGSESLRVLMSQMQGELAKLKVTGGNKNFTAARKHTDVAVTPKIQKKEIKQDDIDNPLPDLLNHRAVNHFIKKVPPKTLEKMTVIAVKIENLTEISNQYGKPVLNDIAQKLILEIKQKSRSIDLLGKWNEGEYLLICPNSNIERATGVATELKSAILNRTWLQAINISCSTKAYNEGLSNLSSFIGKTIPPKDLEENKVTVKHETEMPKAKQKTTEELDLNIMTCASTGALNQTGIQIFLKQTSPEALLQMSVVFIDVTQMASIENTQGKTQVESLSKQFVNKINQTCANGIITRWSASEYLLLCPKTTLTEATELANKIEVEIEHNDFSEGITLTCNTEVYDSRWHEAVIEKEEAEVVVDEEIMLDNVTQISAA